MAKMLERPVLHHHEILQFVDFRHSGSLPSWNFEIEILVLLQRHVLHYHVKFCEVRSSCCSDIAFFVFLK